MKFTIDHLRLLNERLPPGYMLDLAQPTQPLLPQPPQPAPPRIPDLPQVPSVTPSPALPSYSTRPSRSQVTEGFRKLFAILSKVKRHPGSVHFQGTEKAGREAQEINLAMVEGRLFREEYENGRQFAEDLRRMCADALMKYAADSSVTAAVVTTRSYFEGLMTGNEDILLTLRKQQRVASESEGCLSVSFSEDERKCLVAKIKVLEEKYLRGIAETLHATEVEKFMERLEERLKELQPAALKGLSQHVDSCIAKSRRLPGPQLAPGEPAMQGSLRLSSPSASASAGCPQRLSNRFN